MEQVAKAEALANRQQEQRLEFLNKQAEEGHKFFEEMHLDVEPEPAPVMTNPTVPELYQPEVPAAAQQH